MFARKQITRIAAPLRRYSLHPTQPELHYNAGTGPRPRYIRPILFAGAFSAASFYTAAAVYEHHNSSRSSWWGATDSLRARFRRSEEEEERRRRHESALRWLESSALPFEMRKACAMVINRYYDLREGQRSMIKVIAINTLVFLGWQIPHPAARQFMRKWFLHHPLSGRSVTLITSVFSHQTPIHLLFNMVGLYSFGSLLHDVLGKEEFFAMYLSAGVASSLASHLLTLRTMPMEAILPSLGASGALYACLGASAARFPDLKVGLIFLPSTAMPLEYAFPALVSVDVVGILAKWQTFDHFSHLSGAGFGYLYMKYWRHTLWHAARGHNVYHFTNKAVIEESLLASGLPVSVYMSNYFKYSEFRPVKVDDTHYKVEAAVHVDRALPMLDAEHDTGLFVADMLERRDELLGKRVHGYSCYMTSQEVMDQVGEFTGKAIEYKYTPVPEGALDAMSFRERDMVEVSLYFDEHGFYDLEEASKKQKMPSGLSTFKSYLERERPTL
ncbi:hypothetical protein RI367_008353 [Sorochytrium milnesiophthora]